MPIALLHRFPADKAHQLTGNPLPPTGFIHAEFVDIADFLRGMRGRLILAAILHHRKATDDAVTFTNQYVRVFGFQHVVRVVLHRLRKTRLEQIRQRLRMHFANLGAKKVDGRNILPHGISNHPVYLQSEKAASRQAECRIDSSRSGV